MKTIIETIKIFAAIPAVLFDLAFFMVGIFCLYGGPDGAAFSSNAFMGAAIGVGTAAIMALLSLAIYKFDKQLLLILLILHEIILFFWLTIAIASCKELPQIMVHFILSAGLLAGGYGIFKTAKAIKAEDDK